MGGIESGRMCSKRWHWYCKFVDPLGSLFHSIVTSVVIILPVWQILALQRRLRDKITPLIICCLPVITIILDTIRTINDIDVQRRSGDAVNPEQMFVWRVFESVVASIFASQLSCMLSRPFLKKVNKARQQLNKSWATLNISRPQCGTMAFPKTREDHNNSEDLESNLSSGSPRLPEIVDDEWSAELLPQLQAVHYHTVQYTGTRVLLICQM